MKKNTIYLSGFRFGKRVIVTELPPHITFNAEKKRSRRIFLCECDCGRRDAIQIDNIPTSSACNDCKAVSMLHQHRNDQAQEDYVYRDYQKSARTRNIVFDLLYDEFVEMIALNCNYCNTPPSNRMNRYRHNGKFAGEKVYARDFVYSGVDRINPEGNYVKENCVPCCFDCNRSKTNKTEIEFLNWIENIHAHSDPIKIRSESEHIIERIADIKYFEANGTEEKYKKLHRGIFPNKLQAYNSYKSGAKSRNIEFGLTIFQFEILAIQNCNYCNVEPANKFNHANRETINKGKSVYAPFIYNGIDRVVSSQGYFIKNCVPCCIICNIAKTDNSAEKFLSWADGVYKHSISRNFPTKLLT